MLEIKLETRHADVIARWFEEDVLGEMMVGSTERALAMRAFIMARARAKREVGDETGT